MSILLFFHILAIGIWIGVVGAEFVIEFDGMKSDEARIRASRLHYLTDIWIEVPAFLIVLGTGLLMFQAENASGLFLTKVVFGLLAVGFNGICVLAVFRRQKFAAKGDKEGMDSVEPLMKFGGLIIPVFLVAFGLGLYFVLTH